MYCNNKEAKKSYVSAYDRDSYFYSEVFTI